jgi:hypothetical protein
MIYAINTIDELQKKAQDIAGRVRHHAKPIEGTLRTVIGALLLRFGPGVYSHNGGGVLWASFAPGRRPTFAYNHHTKSIEVRDGSLRGAVLYSFNDSVPAAMVARAIAAL